MSEEKKIISELITKARAAQALLNDYPQAKIDELITAIAWEVINPKTNAFLSKMAVETTEIGHVESKIIKNRRKTIGLLRDLKNVKTTGIIKDDRENGLIEIARPIGVVGAIVPSTNPIATPLNKVINAIKCRNAIILAPSPKGAIVCQELIMLIHAAIERVGGAQNLVQKLPSPVSKELTNELTRQVDIIIATGSQNNILRSQQSGTPTLGVGVGNVVSIVDNSANIADAVNKIVASKTFDYATSCSSENSLVIIDDVYDQTIAELEKHHCIVLNEAEKAQLQRTMWDGNHTLNRNIVAQSAQKIASIVGLSDDKFNNVQILLVKETSVGKDYPFSGEKISPILTIYRAKDFSDSVKITKNILSYQGAGHSCSIHSNDDNHILTLGETLPVCRVIVNQAHCFATGGNFDNCLPFSLSMGCGTWGNNVVDTNINYTNYLNITKIVRPIPKNEPTAEEIFGAYWKKYEIEQDH